MRLYLTLPLFILINMGCKTINSENREKSPSSLPGDSIEQLIFAADSQWNDRMGETGGFIGIHSHGKDLAVHAHQDIGKSRRILRESYKLLPQRESAYDSELDQRKKILIEKGLLKVEKKDP